MLNLILGLALLASSTSATTFSSRQAFKTPSAPSVTLCGANDGQDVTVNGVSDGIIDSYYGIPFASPRELSF